MQGPYLCLRGRYDRRVRCFCRFYFVIGETLFPQFDVVRSLTGKQRVTYTGKKYEKTAGGRYRGGY